METRIEKLEDFAPIAHERLVRIETRVDGISANMATKADIASMKADIAALETTLLKWFIGTSIALSGLAFAVARFLK